ncbi:MAG: CvpA family protein [Dehalococcoidia bacterium]
MNWVDIFILVLVLGLGFLGWRNGLIRWAFTLIGGILGVILAGRLYETVSPLIPFGSEGVQQIVAFGAIFLAVMIGAWIVSRVVKTMLNVLMLGWVDHTAGAALGLLAGAFAVTAVISAMGIVPSDSIQNAVSESTLATPLVNSMGIVLTFLPEEFDQVKDLVTAGD